MSYSTERVNELLKALGNLTGTPHSGTVDAVSAEDRNDWLKDNGFMAQKQAPATAILNELTLRDIFAGFALAGILGCFKDYGACKTTKKRSELAFEYADEMLAIRKKSTP